MRREIQVSGTGGGRAIDGPESEREQTAGADNVLDRSATTAV